MIIDPPSTTMQSGDPIPSENPPAYESAITGTSVAPPPSGKNTNPQDTQPKGPELMLASGPQLMYGATTSQATVFYYQDPRTGQRVASLLPPDHPQMVCLQAGEHVPETRYGFLGVIAAIVWFPLGIGLCLLDRRVQCKRCGEAIEEGLCS
ncbi:hypothetical protein DFH94DRAFT_777524 [Russula ochroleuca]|uniref:Brain protein I3 n=1 Tax=Russula ochroleuca TaxID=152965 RepID=A0A9P5JXG4_9AGAM|nr:hypothetical protein DFH94DRAFT_777524 [Russula ochroleuca]